MTSNFFGYKAWQKLQILVKCCNFFIVTLRTDLKHIGLFLESSLKTNLQFDIFKPIIPTKLSTFVYAKRKLILTQWKL